MISKKGQLAVKTSLRFLGEIILVIMILSIAVAYTYNLSKSSNMEMAYISKDIALVLDSFTVPQGNVYLNYGKETFEFSYRLRNTFDVLDTSEGKEPRPEMIYSSLLFKDQYNKYNKSRIDYEGIRLVPTLYKDGNNIHLSNRETPKILSYSYIDAPLLKELVITTTHQDLRDLTESIALRNQKTYSQNKDPSKKNIILSNAENNLIFCPTTLEDRRFCSIFSNKLIEKDMEIVILPTNSNDITIQISPVLKSDSNTLQEAIAYALK